MQVLLNGLTMEQLKEYFCNISALRFSTAEGYRIRPAFRRVVAGIRKMQLSSSERSDNRSNVGRTYVGLILLLTILITATEALAQPCTRGGTEVVITGLRGRLFVDPGRNVLGEETELDLSTVSQGPGTFRLDHADPHGCKCHLKARSMRMVTFPDR